MLSPAPSVKAAAEFEKNAYKLTLPTLGLSNHEVVAVTPTLPGLLALPAIRLKFTAFPDNDTLIESVSTACSVIVLAPELSTCACSGEASAANITASTAATRPNFVCQLIRYC